MRKVRLDLKELEVESFAVPSPGLQRGTVQGRATAADTFCDQCVSLGYTGCAECNSGYTDDRCGGCGSGLTCGCASYEGCTQDPNATECYSDWHPTACGFSCFHQTQCC